MKDSITGSSEVINLEKLDKEAYSTLADWAKSAPRIIKQLEAEGKKDELKKFKLQIKLVVNKLQDIKQILKKNSDVIG
ncbi:hypothetical protein OAN38_03945 [Candidatus Marinimicrobia bacterium]|jgi:hypothetical protein|nr:hypothetical protein [Candidatus Neomarinimicrobiota bacterium]MDC0383978.1 hypothetical protein [Candidatus Neomarinimicrobiota bacterium]